MDLMLTDKVAVVTGASKGIGLAVTKALVEEGAMVSPALARTAALTGLDRVTAVAVDLADPAAPGQLVQRALDDHGRIDILVNNVGAVRMRLDGFLGTSDEEFEWAMQMNFFTTLRATRAAIVAMVAQGSGAIVNVASVNAFFQPDGGTIDYGAAKAAVVNLDQVAGPGVRSEGHPRQRGFPRPGQHRLVARRARSGQTVAAATGVDADTARERVVASIGGFATGPLHDARGGGHPHRAAGVRADCQRDRSQLRH